MRLILFAAVTVALAFAGCGGDEEKKSPPPPVLDQRTPKALAESIFAIAKHGNLAALSGVAAKDADGDSKDIGTISTAPALEQAEFKKHFSTGTVTGEKVHGDEAEVDIRFGPDGKKAEKLQMVKVGEKWYLQGF